MRFNPDVLMALPGQGVPGREATWCGILSPAPPGTKAPRRRQWRSPAAERGVPRLPADLLFAHRSPDRAGATHAGHGPSTPTKEEEGFGAFACPPIAGECAKTSCGSGTGPERSWLRAWHGPSSFEQTCP